MRERSSRRGIILGALQAVGLTVTMGIGTLLPNPALAAIATSALQWTQLAQLEQQVEKQIATLSTVVKQFEAAKSMLNLETLAGEMGLPVELFRSVQALRTEIDNLKRFRNELVKVEGSVDQLKGVWNTRFSLAQRNGITYEQQVLEDAVAYKRKNERAIKRLEQEKQLYAAVEEDYKRAQEWGNKITGTKGIHESAGLLNVQMNQVLQQNARVVQLLAQQQGYDKADEESEAAAKKLADLRRRQEVHEREIRQKQEMNNALRNWQ